MSALLEHIQTHPIFYKGEKVVTLPMIDKLHERPEGTAGRNFRKNRGRFVEGEDFWDLETSDVLRRELISGGYLKERAAHPIILSESGYFKVTKTMRDDESWNVFNSLIKCYFRAKKEDQALSEVGLIIEESGKMISAMAKALEEQNSAMREMASSAAKIMSLKRWHSNPNPLQKKLPFEDKKSLGES